MNIIAHIETDYNEKFGIPRQSGLNTAVEGRIVFEKEYRVAEAFRGLEDFSHIWILWQFSEAVRENWSPTVRPPLLGGNKRMGVFSTRSPFRPNNIGLSAVKLLRIEYTKNEGPVLIVQGADLMNGTPIYDIKPYLPYADSIPDAVGGFTEGLGERRLTVEIPDDLKGKFPKEKLGGLIAVLEGDPRPSYQNDPERIFTFTFAACEVSFSVDNGVLRVIGIGKKSKQKVDDSVRTR